MRRSFTTPFALTLAATLAVALAFPTVPAAAQEGGAEERFHRAFEQEVVDGQLQEAARVYLDLMRDEAVPARLRAESRFRFAVTTVLLGRPDEGRAQLAELARDASAPEGLRARAGEYLESLRGLAVGSEVEKKLGELVFELGRTDPADPSLEPNVYRDVEVIGKAAEPFLRTLARHPDLALRRHAFRLMLRMGAEDAISAWSPEVHLKSQQYRQELERYLAGRPEQQAALEQALLALPDAELAAVLADRDRAGPARFQPFPVSAPFLRAAATRGVPPSALVSFLERGAHNEPELQALRVEWVRTATGDLGALSAISFVLHQPSPRPGDGEADPAQAPDDPTELFRAVVSQLLGRGVHHGVGLSWQRFGAAVPVPELVGVLRGVVAAGAEVPLDSQGHPFRTKLAHAVAAAIDARKPTGADASSYAAVLQQWVDAVGDVDARLLPSPNSLRHVLRELPVADASVLALWLLESRHPNSELWAALPAGEPRDVEVALPLLRVASEDLRSRVLQQLSLTGSRVAEHLNVAYARAVLRHAPELLRLTGATAGGSTPNFVPYLALLPTQEASQRLVEAFTAAASVADLRQRQSAQLQLSGRGLPVQQLEEYVRHVLLPVADQVWALSDEEVRRGLVYGWIDVLKSARNAETRQMLAALLLARAGDLPEGYFPASNFIQAGGDLVDLAELVPRLDERVVSKIPKLPDERAVSAVEAMTRDPARVNGAVVHFVVRHAPADAAGPVVDRLLRTVPVANLSMVTGALLSDGRPASAEALEDALVRALVAEPPNLSAVRDLTRALVARNPTERLFPAVRALLASPEHVGAALDMATALAREELLPQLVELLDTMDAGVRQKAREAIDAVMSLRRLRQEALDAARDGGK
jgi:hypothetical protein